MKILLTSKEGFEKVLIREVAACGFTSQADGKGWVLAEGADVAALQRDGGLCFACDILQSPTEVQAESTNAFAKALVDVFVKHLGQRQTTAPWGLRFFSFGDEKLGRYTDTLRERWLEAFRKKMSRVAKLAQDSIPQGPEPGEGFFVFVTDFNKALVSFQAMSQGQQRMKLDPQSPSRSYLKLEEAFHIFARAPKDGETVVDLGAAPGGWSLSALKRGASVIAVDNGPLREPVKSHPRMKHLMTDALTYQHAGPAPVDWLLCDVLEKPEMIVELLRKWLGRKWCRYFIVNLKVGRRDPIALIEEIRDGKTGLLPYCRLLSMRQLYHDREEITLMGEVK
ncbi:MAG: rRNA methyltransferase [Candidatus Omnitrophica bacterium]|nr:rRNA methyltransferase [Candidatus Omnitrophota bacterium]